MIANYRPQQFVSKRMLHQKKHQDAMTAVTLLFPKLPGMFIYPVVVCNTGLKNEHITTLHNPVLVTLLNKHRCEYVQRKVYNDGTCTCALFWGHIHGIVIPWHRTREGSTIFSLDHLAWGSWQVSIATVLITWRGDPCRFKIATTTMFQEWPDNLDDEIEVYCFLRRQRQFILEHMKWLFRL